MTRSRHLAALLAAIVLCAPGAAFAQSRQLAQDGAGVSTQPPVSLDDGSQDPAQGKATSPGATAGSELPNTGSDPRLLFLAGIALTFLGVGLRLRTADAELY